MACKKSLALLLLLVLLLLLSLVQGESWGSFLSLYFIYMKVM